MIVPESKHSSIYSCTNLRYILYTIVPSQKSATYRRLLHHTVLASLFATFGCVIYKSKLLSPSFLTPCDYRMQQSPTKGQVLLVLLWGFAAVSYRSEVGRFERRTTNLNSWCAYHRLFFRRESYPVSGIDHYYCYPIKVFHRKILFAFSSSIERRRSALPQR